MVVVAVVVLHVDDVGTRNTSVRPPHPLRSLSGAVQLRRREEAIQSVTPLTPWKL